MGSHELIAYLNQYLESTKCYIEVTNTFLVRMDRRNNTSIVKPPKSLIEVITRFVITEKKHDTQMYESHYEEENIEILEEESPCEEEIEDLEVEEK